MKKDRWIGIIVGMALLWGTLVWGQNPPAPKPAPSSPEKASAPAQEPQKKKMKKVHTLFGDVWVEDTEGTETQEKKEPEKPAAPAPAATPATGEKPKPSGPEQAAPPQPTPGAQPAAGQPSSPAALQSQPPPPVTKPGEVAKAEEKKAEAPEGQPTTQPVRGGHGASLVFNNADLVQVVQVIANLLHLNYVMDPTVKGVASITTMGEINNADLMQILQTLLRINGATAIQSGNLWQIVPLKNAHAIPVPLQSPGGAPLAPDDTLVTEIVPMEFVTSADMTKILKEFLSDAGSIVSYDQGNILILTDASRNMSRLLDLVRTFDADVMANHRLRLFTVKNDSARSLVTDLKSIFGAYSQNEKDSAIHFIPIDRMNAILAVAPNPAALDVVQQWIDKLDKPSQVAGVRNYVYPLQFAKASEIQKLLGELYGSALSGPSTEQTSQQGVPVPGAAYPSTAGLSPSTILSQPARPEETKRKEEFGFQGRIKVVADDLNNLMIIQCTPQDYDLIQQTIRQIDVMPRQVLIQAQVFSVDLSHDFSLGVEYQFQQKGTAPNKTPLASFTNGAFSGSGVILNAGARELFASITSTENRTRTKALSSPSILATDNQEARIQVGVSIPTLSSTGFSPSANNVIFNTVQNVDTGVILSVTPHVSAGGFVGMKITQEVSSPVTPPAGVTNISPSINRSSASTSFVVRDGETVAIAGIISETKSLTRTRIPVLGDIPVLGAAFGSTTTGNKRSELIIFITPHVINNLDQQEIVSDALRGEMKKLKGDMKDNDKNRAKVWDKVPAVAPQP